MHCGMAKTILMYLHHSQFHYDTKNRSDFQLTVSFLQALTNIILYLNQHNKVDRGNCQKLEYDIFSMYWKVRIITVNFCLEARVCLFHDNWIHSPSCTQTWQGPELTPFWWLFLDYNWAFAFQRAVIRLFLLIEIHLFNQKARNHDWNWCDACMR